MKLGRSGGPAMVRSGVSSVMVISLRAGHVRDHAGWGPLQEEQMGSFAGHLFGGWLLGHCRQTCLFWQAACSWPNWKHLAH
jgi:hypothetical protein